MKKVLAALIMGISLSSCFSPGVYVQKSTNTPAFEGENEFKVSTTSTFRELNMAYTPVNHLGIIANGIYRSSDGDEVTFSDKAYPLNQKYYLGELGLGYYTNWNDNKFFFETYGGVGFGKTQYQKANYYVFPIGKISDIENYESRITQFFVTPAVGYRIPFADKCKAIFILSTNLNGVQFSDYSPVFKALQANSTYYFLSPALTSRLQFSYFELQMQLVSYNQLNKDVVPTYNPLLFSYDKEFCSKNNWGFTLGVSINLNKLIQTYCKGK